MALTPIRWLAALIGGCLIVAVIAIRPVPQAVRPDDPAVTFGEREYRYAVEANQAAGRLRLALLLDSIRAVAARSPMTPIRTFRDAAIPAIARTSLDSLAARAVRPVRDSGKIGIDIVFLFDTLSSLRGANPRPYSTVVDYVLPRRSDERCVALVRIGPGLDLRREIVRTFPSTSAANRLLGPCAYYRTFGMPGRQIDGWLRNRGWAFAGASSWTHAVPALGEGNYNSANFMFFRPGFFDWRPSVVQCGAGVTSSCEHGVLDGHGVVDRRGAPALWQGNILYHAYSWLNAPGYSNSDASLLGPKESFLLADMVREMGRDRFAKFWTSNDSVPAAFQSATSESLGVWTSRWAVETYGRMSRGPTITASTALVATVLFLLGVYVAIRVSAGRQYA
jgi:hypothetical protein